MVGPDSVRNESSLQVSPGRHSRTGYRRGAPHFAIGLVGMVAVLAAFTAALWDGPLRGTDSTLDWLVVQAASTGVNPYTPLDELGAMFGVEGLSPGVAPRLPGALVVLSGLLPFSVAGAFDTMLLLNSAALIVLFIWALPQLAWSKRHLVVALSPALLASTAVYSNFRLGQWSILIALLIAFAWLRAVRLPALSGAALGVAAALKLWPALVLVPLVFGRNRRAVAAATGMFAGLNALGLLIYRLAPSEVIIGMSASTTWTNHPGNGSVFGFIGLGPATLGLVVTVAVGALVLAWNRAPATMAPLAIVLGTLVSPVSWEHYDVALIAVAVWCLGQNQTTRLIGALWLVWQVVGTLSGLLVGPHMAALLLLGRTVLAVAVVASWSVYGKHTPTLPAHAPAAPGGPVG